jgi:dienelactone hydrolase
VRRILALALLALASCAAEPQAPGVADAPKIADMSAAVVAQAKLYRPRGNGPFPAVVVLHGCGGLTGHHHAWGRRLVEWGYVAIVPDSFGPRGHGGQCALNPAPTPADTRAGDAWTAAKHLAGLPFVRGDRIGMIGFSHGGRTVLSAAQAGSAVPPFAAAVAYYPGCDERLHARIGVPTLILAGEKDDWTPIERCRAVVRAQARPGLVLFIAYPNAYHGFDRQSEGPTYVRGSRADHRVERDPVAAPDSLARTKAFFEQWLKG